MAKIGVLGRKAISAGAQGSDQVLYRVPTETAATITLSVAQKAATSANFSVSLAEPGENSIQAQDVIVFDQNLNYREEYQRKGIVLGSQQAVIVNADSAGPTFLVWGFEDVD